MAFHQVKGAFILQAFLGSSRLAEHSYSLSLVHEIEHVVVGMLKRESIPGEFTQALDLDFGYHISFLSEFLQPLL